MPVKIGCDPEFTLVNEHGQKITFNYSKRTKSGIIKPDHCGAVGEFNPTADLHPGTVVRNLRKLITKTKSHFNNYTLQAGGGKNHNHSTGGHIHFSSNTDFTSSMTSRDYSWSRRHTTESVETLSSGNKLTLSLDSFIGMRMQKMLNGKRHDKSYNQLSKIKRKNYEGCSGFEYRSAPSFIVTPQFTEATLSTAQRIAEMWITKNDAFDSILSRNGTTNRGKLRRTVAKRKDFNLLLPTGRDTKDRYYRNQIRYFVSTVFNKQFDLGDNRMLDFWTNTTVAGNPSVPITGNREIQLQPCQLKLIDYNEREDFESEQVFKIVRFAVPEVKIYPINGMWVPWRFRLSRDRKLDENKLYISKNLRPFIKMPRGVNFKLRFCEFNTRLNRDVGTGQGIDSVIFYNKLDSNEEIVNFINNIFDNCVRTRLRRNDARTINA